MDQDIDSVTIDVDRADRSPLDRSSSRSSGSSSPAPAPIYSDISDDDVPPPPTVPHPTVIQKLDEVTERPQYDFSRTLAPVPSALIALVHRDCKKKIPVLMKKLVQSASGVGDVTSFRKILSDHRKDITLLIRIVRVTAVRYLKNSGSTKQQVDSIKFALFKRLGVWRDQIDSVIRLSEHQSGWYEERRKMLWRRLQAACRWRMMGLEIRDTFRREDIVDG